MNVLFEKPDLPRLTAKYDWVIDMHYHSCYSIDGFGSIADINKSCREKGISAAITDHNEIAGCLEASRLKAAKIIRGIEVSCKESTHMMFYFFNDNEMKKFHKNLIKLYQYTNPFTNLKISFETLMRESKKYDCICAVPHPCGKGWTSLNSSIGVENLSGDIIKRIDLVQAITSYNIKKSDEMAIAWAQKIKKGIIGGSDGHTIKELGGAVTCCNGDDLREMFSNLIKGKGIVIGTHPNNLQKTFITIKKEIPIIMDCIKKGNEAKRFKCQLKSIARYKKHFKKD